MGLFELIVGAKSLHGGPQFSIGLSPDSFMNTARAASLLFEPSCSAAMGSAGAQMILLALW